MQNVVFWEVPPCGSCRNRRFGLTYRLHLQSENNQRNNNTFTLKIEAICSSETLDYTRTTRRHIPKDGILHSHRSEKPQILYLNSILDSTCIHEPNLISNKERR
jgi:hypothetical protein